MKELNQTSYCKLKSYMLMVSLLIGVNSFSQIFTDDLPGIDSIILLGWGGANIHDLHNDRDSVLYIIGAINRVNGNVARAVVSWDGNEIITYDTDNGINAMPQCVHVYKDTLYVCGGATITTCLAAT